MKNNLYVFFLFFITGLMSCSHHSGLYEHAEKIMSQHPDSVLTLLSTIQDVNDLSEKDRAMYYLLLTEAENKTYVKPTSDSLIAISTEYFDKTEDWGRKAKAWYYRGRINQDLGDALHAQDYYLKALQDESKVNDYMLLGRIYNSIGMLLTYQEVYESAIPYQKRALNCFKLLGDSVGQSFALRDIGRVYTAQKKLDSAIIYYEHALNLGNYGSIPSIYRELACLYLDRGDLQKGHEYIQQALKFKVKKEFLYPTYLGLGKLYQRINLQDSSYYYLTLSKESPILATRAGAYYYLSKIERSKKRWDKYLEYQDAYEVLRDSVSEIKQTESIRKREDLYNFHRAEAKLLQTTIALDKVKIDHLIMTLVASAAIVLLFIITLFSYRQLKNRRKRLLEQKEKLVALKKKQFEDKIRIEQNEKSIAYLEGQLRESSIAFDEKEKELMVLRKQRLEIENQNLRYEKTENKLLVEKFLISDVYYRFHIKEEWRPKEEDWDRLFSALDETYNNFTHRLMGLATKLTTTELRVSCLVKANVPPVTIAMLVVTTPTNVSMIRKRLYEKIHSVKGQGSAEKFDKFIREF